MEEKNAKKAAQRRLGLSARAAIAPSERSEKSREISLAASRLSCFKAASLILFYAASPSEADISLLAGMAVSQGKKAAYPRCTGETEMLALAPRPGAVWEGDFFSMRAPALSCSDIVDPKDIDLVLVPLAAFDAFARRIGRGAGIYDRFLTKCTNAFLLGAAFSAQRVEAAATDAHDVTLNAVVCEDGVWSGGRLTV